MFILQEMSRNHCFWKKQVLIALQANTDAREGRVFCRTAYVCTATKNIILRREALDVSI